MTTNPFCDLLKAYADPTAEEEKKEIIIKKIQDNF
jgi:hypothetical protein